MNASSSEDSGPNELLSELFVNDSLFPQICPEGRGSRAGGQSFQQNGIDSDPSPDSTDNQFQNFFKDISSLFPKKKQENRATAAPKVTADPNFRSESTNPVAGENTKKRKKKRKFPKDFENLGLRNAVVTDFIKKLFLNRATTADFHGELNDVEQKLIWLIIKKKTKADLGITSVGECILLMKKVSQKREEEEFKYVFKLALKELSRKEDFSTPKKIFSHYFKSVAEKDSESIEWYMTPNSAKHPKNMKTFSKAYIERIKKNGLFFKKMAKEIDSLFQPVRLKKFIEKRIERFSKHFFRKFCKAKDFSEVENYLKEFKSKLPWTITESTIAATSLKMLF